MTYQQESDITKLGAVAKYLAIPVPSSEIVQINTFGAALTLVDQWRYNNNDDPNEDNPTSQWHENNYPFWIAGYILEATAETMKIAIVFDQKPQNSNGGTFTSGAWRQRDLNTKQDPDNILSVSTNSITILEGGKYLIRASAPAFQVVYHQLRLTKNNIFLAQGSSEYCTGYVQTRASVVFCGVLAAGDVIKLEHQCGTTVADAGWGIGTNSPFGEEIFSIMEIIQYS